MQGAVGKYGLWRRKLRKEVAPSRRVDPAAALPDFFNLVTILHFGSLLFRKKICFSPVQQDQCYDVSRIIGEGRIRHIALTHHL